MSTEIVGPLPTITFRGITPFDRVRQVYDRPKSTGDPRYQLCRDHHPACDCREAELAEEASELRIYLNDLRAAAQELLRGHRLKHWPDEWLDDPQARDRASRGDGPLACQCGGCRLIRAAEIYLHTDFETGVVTDPPTERRPR